MGKIVVVHFFFCRVYFNINSKLPQLLNIALMAYLIELTHSVASRICISVFVDLLFKWTLCINVKIVVHTLLNDTYENIQ